MNNQFFPNNFNQGCENITQLPPLVTHDVNVVHRYFIVEQPHIQEIETKYCDHVVKRHTCQTVYTTSNECDYAEQCCCNNNNQFLF